MKKNIALGIFFFLLFSCNQEEKIVYQLPKFKTTERLNIEKIGEPSEDKIGYETIKIRDYFVFQYPHINKNRFHIHNVKDMSYVMSFGETGSASYELPSTGGATFRVVNDDGEVVDESNFMSISSTIHVRDEKLIVPLLNHYRILEYDLSMIDRDTIAITNIKTPIRFGCEYVTTNIKNHYVITHYNDHRITVLDKNFSVVKSSDYYAPVLKNGETENLTNKDIEERHRNCGLYTSSIFSPNGKYLAISRHGMLELFETNEHEITPIITKYLLGPYADVLGKINYPDSCISGVVVACSDNYIYYRLYSPDKQHRLITFDWKGIPHKEYTFDLDLCGVCIDEDEKTGYASYETEDKLMQMIKFNL